MGETLRITDFNPEKIAPNFHSFLQQAGEVSYDPEIRKTARWGFGSYGELKEGAAKDVRLNGEIIGQIESYINPPGVYFDGLLPNNLIPKQRRRGRPINRLQRTNDTTNTTRVILTYHWEHPLASQVGRGDGWAIPLP